MANATTTKSAKKTKKVRKNVQHACIYLLCTANNTIVTVTDTDGNALAQASAGAAGFRGTRKSTPYAAQVAAENAMKAVSTFGIEKANVFVKGIGVGRDQSLRGIASSGIEILSIIDTTSIAHGGCRKRKVRRP